VRDPNRLDTFYEKIKTYHKENFPDLRFSQLMINFFTWYRYNYKNDGFYLEEDEYLKRFKEFISNMTGGN
jgi:hypothetical protein